MHRSDCDLPDRVAEPVINHCENEVHIVKARWMIPARGGKVLGHNFVSVSTLASAPDKARDVS
jgi:hypothetical protein